MKNLIKIKVVLLVFVALACYVFQTSQRAEECKKHAIDLRSEGWSVKASKHISECEAGIIEKDTLYCSYM